jgi:ketosteroid isomerase-like protein
MTMDDKAAVKEINARFYEALSAQDLAAMETVWLHEPWVRCVHPGWEMLTGWQSIRKSWANIFKNTSYLKIHASKVTVHASGDVAWVVCTENIASAQDANYQTATALATNVYHRFGTGWLLVHHHASPVTVNVPVQTSESIQ